jgi:hypothetical protein
VQGGRGLAILDRWRHQTVERRGVRRAGARLKLGVKQPIVDVIADLSELLEGVGGEGAVNAEVVGVVDGLSVRSARPSLKYCLTFEVR